jgi:hypothetical protein
MLLFITLHHRDNLDPALSALKLLSGRTSAHATGYKSMALEVLPEK